MSDESSPTSKFPLLGFTGDLETGTTLANTEDGPIKNELGTINGVYVPCLLNILGAVLFLRIGTISSLPNVCLLCNLARSL